MNGFVSNLSANACTLLDSLVLRPSLTKLFGNRVSRLAAIEAASFGLSLSVLRAASVDFVTLSAWAWV